MEQSIEWADLREVDFRVVREDYCRYQLDDGTLMRVKMCTLKIAETAGRGPGGYPGFAFHVNNMLTSLVPDRLKSAPARQAAEVNVEDAEEIGFTVQEEAWQEYELVDGFVVRIKPVVTKIFKHRGHNAFGEPIYSIPAIQHIQDADRARPGRPPAG